MTMKSESTTATGAPPQGLSWNQRIVPFMAASVGFLFLSFVLVSLYAWFYTDAAVQAARVGALRSLLVSSEPASPSPDLAGRVVHVRGTATVGQPVADTSIGVTFERALTVQRIVERFRSGRNAGWNPDEMRHLPSPGVRLGGWSLTEPLLAAAPSALEPMRPGADYRLPAGMMLSESDPWAAYHVNSAKARTSDPAKHLADGDRRLMYRALRDGPLSVIAAVDKTGQELVPVRIDGDNVALLANGAVDAAVMIDDALKDANATRVETTLWAFAVGWAAFLIPALWAPMRRWAALTLVPLAGVVATLGAAMAAAVPGGIAGSFLAGQAVATAYVLVIVLLARRRGALG